MSNSKLVTYTNISKNKNSPRNHAIDRITIHCIVGQWTAKQGCDYFASTTREASANYVVGKDGSIGLSVDEGDRSWCSSNASNDHRAVTIEVASDTAHPYAVTEAAYNALLSLVADICQRNGKTKLLWLADKEKTLSYTPRQGEMVMTVHRWFAAKACPGDYLYNRHGDIAAKVNARLSGSAGAESYTVVTGAARASAEQMAAYLKAKNPGAAQSVFDMIPLYLSEGAAEGIRGDVAFAQSCLETGNFGFKGSAVTLDQNNFCGMGVTANGVKGNSFDTPQMGIRAQIQHLKAYANSEALKNPCIDPRFQYVTRGSAPYVEWLGQKENPDGKGWAAGAGYGGKILAILSGILAVKVEPAGNGGAAARYNKISDMPGYAQDTIRKMVDGGIIGGGGTGAKDGDGRPADLDLSLDMIRIFVTNDRAGLYDR